MIKSFIKDLETAGYIPLKDFPINNLKSKQISYLERGDSIEFACYSTKDAEEICDLLKEKNYKISRNMLKSSGSLIGTTVISKM